MSSITLTNTNAQAQSDSGSTAWKRLWRTDAVLNLLAADLMLFAAVPIQKTLDMSPDAVTPMRVIGALFVVYALFQLWFTRQGEPPRIAYQLAAVDMDITGTGFALVLLAGVEMNTAGAIISGAISVMAFILAVLYWVRSRQLA